MATTIELALATKKIKELQAKNYCKTTIIFDVTEMLIKQGFGSTHSREISEQAYENVMTVTC